MNTAHLTEAISTLLDDLVDPRDALLGEDGQIWQRVGSSDNPTADAGLSDEETHRAIRDQCRQLAATNEFAINGHENRISYIIGSGHTVRALARHGNDTTDLDERVQARLDDWTTRNRWAELQEETLRRYDRDGEAILRFFATPDGLQIRFVEPDQLYTPREHQRKENHRQGIETHPSDASTPVAYWIDGRRVPAADIQHRKANVDQNVARGVPLMYPVRKNLRRAERLLRSMTVLAEIQSAFALIRKHRALTTTGIESFVHDESDHQVTDRATGKTRYYTNYQPGMIVDAPEGIDYDFPTTGINAQNYVAVLQAELRSIAARLVMPEYMFTSDASNSNMASTLVAEGPALKMFERQQARIIAHDREIYWRQLDLDANAGLLPANLRNIIRLNIHPPSLQIRDELREAQVEEIAHFAGVMSPQTWAQRLGLDFEQETSNWQRYRDAGGPIPERTHTPSLKDVTKSRDRV